MQRLQQKTASSPQSREFRAAVGGECLIKGLGAGTYDFSVRFKTSSGAVTVKDRELKVSVESF
jgi:hypothetical protein